MTIQIDGANTINKGAELMFYAVLEEIERRYPEATVIYNGFGVGYKKLDSPFKIKGYTRLSLGTKPWGVQKRLGLPYGYLTGFHPVKGIDMIIDISGFKLGDQWKRDNRYLRALEKYYIGMKGYGTQVFLLPQALGPFLTPNGRKTVEILDKYVDFIFPRERESYQYLVDGGIKKSKVLTFPDFTNIVKGEFPVGYEDFKGKVCIIPNEKMIAHDDSGSERYISFIYRVITVLKSKGMDVFLLNHEDKGDRKVCKKINKLFNNELKVIEGLNAKEIKGIIGSSYFTFSSRYHGVANALSQGIPCIATSWSHKYKLLFEDYGLENKIMDTNSTLAEIETFLSDYISIQGNETMRGEIGKKKDELIEKTKEMWKIVWNEMKR
jgi:polysaccharide pyruvyl transferase WcaK-like protein